MYSRLRRSSVSRRRHLRIPVPPPIKKALAVTLARWRAVSRPWQFTAATGALILAVTAGYLVLNLGESPSRARQYLAFKACLLTDAQGINGELSSAIWAGMGQASLTTRARIQYLPVFGPPTVPNALPYLASLVQRHCDVIVAAGRVPAATISSAAPRYPEIRFITVGANGTGRNLTSLTANDPQAPATVRRLIVNAVNDQA